MNKYMEIMDQIVVTDEMRERILYNIGRQSSPSHTPRFQRNQLYILAAAAVLVVICGVTFGNVRRNPNVDTGPEVAMSTAESAEAVGTAADAADAEGAQESEQTVAAVWNAQEYASAQELSDAVGFPAAELATLPFDVVTTRYTDIAGTADITYTGADGEEVSTRKSMGTEDNSGDYTLYENEETAEIGGWSVTIKGDDDLDHLAIWNDGTYAYSIYVTNGCSREAMQTMIAELQS